MITTKEIGKIFKEEREKQNLSVDEACQRSRIHSNVIKDIESGIFDRMGKIYLKSFISKYAIFLEMDTEKIMREFEEIVKEMPGREFSLDIDEKALKEETFEIDSDIQKKIQIFIIAGIGTVFIIILFFLIGLIKSRKRSTPAKQVSTVEHVKPAAKEKRKPRPKDKSATVVLTLKTRGDVWLQIKSEEDDLLFAGIIEKGKTKTWEHSGPLKIWTGKAEWLEFTLNGNKLGIISKGVVKDIDVSERGIRVDNAWVTRLD